MKLTFKCVMFADFGWQEFSTSGGVGLGTCCVAGED